MIFFYSPWQYLLELALWLVALGLLLRLLLRKRRTSEATEKPGRLRIWNLALSLWMVFALLTGVELCFAFFVNHTDASNQTMISQRWMKRYIDGQKNNVDFRDTRDFSKTMQDGVQRIAFLGDSFTAGHGVRRREDRFTDLIADRLENAQPGKYVVANLGELGYETTLVESLVKATLDRGNQIDVVIYVFMMNDIEGFDPRTQEAIATLKQSEPRFFLFRHTYFLNWMYFRVRQATAPESGAYFSHLVDSYDSPVFGQLTGKLKDLQQTCQRHNVEFRMVIFPFLHNLGAEYPFTEAHSKLVRFCETQKIPVLDLEPILTPYADEGLTVNRYDAHPNERAHRLAAEAIEEQLLQDYFLGE